MKLTWIKNNFICKDLYAPFILDRDEEYLNDLSKKYNIILKQAIEAGADEESIKIIKKYKKKIRESLKCYYRADMVRSNSIIRNLLKDVGDNHLRFLILIQVVHLQVMQMMKFNFLDVERVILLIHFLLEK